jgi:hypothetical protein
MMQQLPPLWGANKRTSACASRLRNAKPRNFVRIQGDRGANSGMIPKSGYRFSEKIMRQQ